MLFTHKIPCIVFCRGFEPDKQFLKTAEEADIPILSSPLITMKFINLATLSLEMMFAPRGTDMGSMVTFSSGCDHSGESGIGKSECARLDRTGLQPCVRRYHQGDSGGWAQVMGTSAEITRNHMEVRGIGIVNRGDVRHARRLSGKRGPGRFHSSSGMKCPMWTGWGWKKSISTCSAFRFRSSQFQSGPDATWPDSSKWPRFKTKLKASGYNPANELNQRLIAKMTGNAPVKFESPIGWPLRNIDR
jgi:HPr kinase/phosphorylase